MTTSSVELRSLQKAFPGFTLGPVSVTFAPGRVYGLLGPNGAGKTTLLDVVAFQTRATSGDVSYGGKRIVWGDARWKEHVAYVREVPAFYGELTVAQTLRLASRLYGRWDEELAVRMKGRLGLRDDQRVRTLSKGTRVKLGIVAALAQRAELVMLDEPTAGVDPTAREELQEILDELRHQRPELTIVLSSHIFEDLETSADEILILRNGHIVFQASRERLETMSLYRIPADLQPDVRYPEDDVLLAWVSNKDAWIMTRSESSAGLRIRATPGCVDESSGSLLAAAYRGTGHLARQGQK